MKYRPQRGSLDKSMAEAVEVADMAALVEHMRKSVIDWYPPDELPTVETIKIEPYLFDDRIGWNTHIVTVNGSPWGFTDGPVPARHERWTQEEAEKLVRDVMARKEPEKVLDDENVKLVADVLRTLAAMGNFQK